ncbi:MAG: PLP-dependent aminotransferase family protein [Actinomycetota bacterium]
MLWLKIDRSLKVTLAKQLFKQLRDKILSNELKSGERLPSTRNLSKELNISRNIIVEVYNQLIAEGYLESREGSGTYVIQNIHLASYKIQAGSSNKYISDEKTNREIIDFNSGIPDLEKFPRSTWFKFLRNSFLDMPEYQLAYGKPQGLFDLRLTLSGFLLKTKGIKCHPDQIIILSGSSEGFLIIGKLLKQDYAGVIIEDPIYNGIQKIFNILDIKLYPIPVDERGIKTDLFPENIKDHFISITPSHQFPTGSVLPIQRRIELIELAKNMNTCIIENDYDSEFRYTGPQISSLHLLDPGIVIHIGTFSESLYPSLRLGYMVIPESLVRNCCEIKESYGLFTSSICQIALSNFIKEGFFERHINKMKRLYKSKRKILIDRLKYEFGSLVKISGDSTGLYIVAEFKNVTFTDQIINELLNNKVRVYRVEDHSIIKGKYKNKIILGYGNLKNKEIEEGIKRIKESLKEYL